MLNIIIAANIHDTGIINGVLTSITYPVFVERKHGDRVFYTQDRQSAHVYHSKRNAERVKDVVDQIHDSELIYI